MIVGETLAVEGVMGVLCRNAWGTLYHQYDLQISFAEGIGDVRAWPEGPEVDKRLILRHEFRRLGVVVVKAAEILSLWPCLCENDGKKQMTVIALISTGLHHVVVALLKVVPTMTVVLAINKGPARAALSGIIRQRRRGVRHFCALVTKKVVTKIFALKSYPLIYKQKRVIHSLKNGSSIS